MKKYYVQVASKGVLLWLTVFVTSFLMFPVKQSNQVLFDTLIAVVLTFFTALYAVIYFGNIKGHFLLNGIKAGFVWLVINVVLDALFFSWGPMKMSLIRYVEDIGLTYFIIPIVTIAIGFVLSKKI